MYCSYVFRHSNKSDDLISYSLERMTGQIEKLVKQPTRANIIFCSTGSIKEAHCSLHAGRGINLSASAVADNFYGAIDELVDKLKCQLRRSKARFKNHHRRLQRGWMNVFQSPEE